MCSEQPRSTDANHSETGICEHCAHTVPEDHTLRKGLPSPETGSRANSQSNVTQRTIALQPLTVIGLHFHAFESITLKLCFGCKHREKKGTSWKHFHGIPYILQSTTFYKFVIPKQFSITCEFSFPTLLENTIIPDFYRYVQVCTRYKSLTPPTCGHRICLQQCSKGEDFDSIRYLYTKMLLNCLSLDYPQVLK